MYDAKQLPKHDRRETLVAPGLERPGLLITDLAAESAAQLRWSGRRKSEAALDPDS